MELILTGSVVGDDVLPSFTWDSAHNSSYGVPQLIIHFPDGGANDSALLNKFNPFQAKHNETVDDCIFTGHLRDERVAVTLTGGCPFSDTFEVRYFVRFYVIKPKQIFSHFKGK